MGTSATTATPDTTAAAASRSSRSFRPITEKDSNPVLQGRVYAVNSVADLTVEPLRTFSRQTPQRSQKAEEGVPR